MAIFTIFDTLDRNEGVICKVYDKVSDMHTLVDS